MPQQDRLNIAVFIDFDNIEIGVKSTLNEHFDVGTILDAIKERGEVVTKIAYADWTRAGEYSRTLTQHAIRLVQRNLTPGGDKNGADINLALDALEMAFTHPHINAYVIVGGPICSIVIAALTAAAAAANSSSPLSHHSTSMPPA